MTSNEQQNLNDSLQNAAANGRAEEVISLLEAGAEVNTLNSSLRTPLMRAAISNHLAVVVILLAAGADPALRDSYRETAVDDARKKGYGRIVEAIVNFRPKPKETADEVIFHRSLSNRTLEEVFNFATRERFSLLRKSKFGEVEAMTREPFSVIEDEIMLRKAFDEHVRRGGTADEQEIFPRRLAGKPVKLNRD